jgi:hypothetical protein
LVTKSSRANGNDCTGIGEQNLIKAGAILPSSVSSSLNNINIDTNVPIDTTFEVTFQLPNYLNETNVVNFSVLICGTETVTSKGPITLPYIQYGEGMAP